MNTFPSVITDGILLQYADDTTLICSSANSASTAVTMNYQLQLVHSWIADSKMELNSKKSSVMWFMPCRCRHSGSVELNDIVINNKTLQATAKQSDFCHVSNICKRCHIIFI